MMAYLNFPELNLQQHLILLQLIVMFQLTELKSGPQMYLQQNV